MVEYCTNISECKRNLIADHFNDTKWRHIGKCNQMCDFCKYFNKNSMVQKVNCIKEAQLVLEVLEKHSSKSKEKRLTANKLGELCYAEISKSNLIRLNQFEVENLILKMIMNEYLKEDFHFTPYNTICYLVIGPKFQNLKRMNIFEVNLLKNSNSKFPNQLNSRDSLEKVDLGKGKKEKPKTKDFKEPKVDVNMICLDELDNDSEDIMCLEFGDDFVNASNNSNKTNKNKSNRESSINHIDQDEDEQNTKAKKSRKN